MVYLNAKIDWADIPIDEGLPRGEWSEGFHYNFFGYNAWPWDPDEAGICVEVDGTVFIINHGLQTLHPGLKELYPRNERDPEKQAILPLTEDFFLLF